MKKFRWLALGVLVSTAAWAQSNDQQAQKPGPAHEAANGVGDIGAGAGKGAGHLAAGTGRGAADLVTLHPIDASVAVGKGAGKAGKDVTVGTAKGAGKIGQGFGRAVKKIF